MYHYSLHKEIHAIHPFIGRGKPQYPVIIQHQMIKLLICPIIRKLFQLINIKKLSAISCNVP